MSVPESPLRASVSRVPLVGGGRAQLLVQAPLVSYGWGTAPFVHYRHRREVLAADEFPAVPAAERRSDPRSQQRVEKPSKAQPHQRSAPRLPRILARATEPW